MGEREDIEDLIRQLEDLRVQETVLFNRLQWRLREGNAEAFQQRAPYPAAREQRALEVGDTVRITNTIRTNRGVPVTALDREATVTRITATRVYIETVTGHRTWRIPRNLIRTERPAQE